MDCAAENDSTGYRNQLDHHQQRNIEVLLTGPDHITESVSSQFTAVLI